MLENSLYFEENDNNTNDKKSIKYVIIYIIYYAIHFSELNVNISYNMLLISLIYICYNHLIIIKENDEKNGNIANTFISLHNIIHDMKYCYKYNYIFNIISLDYILKQKKYNNNNMNLYTQTEKLCVLQLFDCLFQWKVFLRTSLDDIKVCKINYPIVVFIYPFIDDIITTGNYSKNDIKMIYKSLYNIYPHDMVINNNLIINKYIMNCERIDKNVINEIKKSNYYKPQLQQDNITPISINDLLNKDNENIIFSLNQYIISLPQKVDEITNSQIPKFSSYKTITINNNEREVEYKYINDIRLLIRLYLEILTFKTNDYVIWYKLTQSYIELFYYCVNFDSNLYIPPEFYKSNSSIPYLDGYNQIVQENTNIKNTIEFYFNHISYCFLQTNLFFPNNNNENNELKVNHYISNGFFNYCVGLKSFNIVDNEKDVYLYIYIII